jgi:hypothetical protein
MIEVQLATSDRTWADGSGSRWTLRSNRSGDRYRHEVLVAHRDDSESIIAHSVEDAIDPNWPASPVVQQWDRCTLRDQRIGYVAVGMAGTSHWSVALESRENAVQIDVACRIHQLPSFLGSTYRVADFLRADPAPDARSIDRSWLLRLDGSDALRGSASGAAIVIRAEDDGTRMNWDPLRHWIQIMPTITPTEFPCSVRWKYSIAVQPS